MKTLTISLGTYAKKALQCNAEATANKKSGIISVEQIKGKSRKREIVELRHFYFARAREVTNESFEKIGKAVNRDHASVMHGIKSVNNTFGLRKKYNQFFNRVEVPVLVKKMKEEPIEPMQFPFSNIIPANNREHHGYRVHSL
jgi:hypothetical protein